MASSLALAGLVLSLAAPAGMHAREREDYRAPEVPRLVAEQIDTIEAPDARQGVAVDEAYVYAVVNSRIGKYDKVTGEHIAAWTGPRAGPIGHLNSCFAERGELWCANSNHPETPMGSSIEIFATGTMTHSRSISLGMMDEGSLVWFDRLNDGWIAGFAHYSDETGVSFKDNHYSSVVRFDSAWRRTGGWLFPRKLRDRMAPQAASGGAIGPDGLLYVMGHDRAELYVLRFPEMGPELVHVATVALNAEGQAFDWDESADGRILYAISRPNGEIRGFRIPEVPGKGLRGGNE